MKKTYKEQEEEKKELSLNCDKYYFLNQLKKIEFEIAKIERQQHKHIKEVMTGVKQSTKTKSDL